jgi:pimeloyl-ACP methyl ester carboxylesterase
MWPQFRGLSSVPVLAIRGANSDLFEEGTLKQMAEMHPDFDSVTVEGQGHAPDLGTAGLPGRIAAFLKKVEARH